MVILKDRASRATLEPTGAEQLAKEAFDEISDPFQRDEYVLSVADRDYPGNLMAKFAIFEHLAQIEARNNNQSTNNEI
jgi:hypothetical protein